MPLVRTYQVPGAPPGGAVTPGLTVLPNNLIANATATIEQGTGETITTLDSAPFVNLSAIDISTASFDQFGYRLHPVVSDGSVAVRRTQELWLRVRFDPPFNSIRRMRFWTPGYDPDRAAETGWTLKWGTTSSLQSPVDTASAVATTAVPLADLYVGNVGPLRLLGGATRYSDWVVLQASVSVTDASRAGPVLGYAADGVPVQIAFGFAWSET